MLKKNKKELEVVEATDKPISEEKESDVKEEKEKSNPFSYSGFVVKIFSAAVLLALGLWMLFDRSTAEKLIITVSGVFIIILCLSRSIYLLRTKDLEKKYKDDKNEFMKTYEEILCSYNYISQIIPLLKDGTLFRTKSLNIGRKTPPYMI